ncbi:MAG: transcription-repair coupling factor [Elusimicrobia bacterium]|nr:transcription-repair coupling factor [Elusimicrobiota bacterium]
MIGVPSSGAWAHLGLSILSGRSASPRLLRHRGGRLVFIRSREEDLEDLADALAALAVLFPEAPPRLSAPAFFGEDERGHAAAFERLSSGSQIALVLGDLLDHRVPSPADFAAGRLGIQSGQTLPMGRLVESLARLGYHRVDFVESPGEFAVRGAVVDFFQLEPLRAVRLLYNESAVESIRGFDVATQAGGDFIGETVLLPVHARAEKDRPSEPLARWLELASPQSPPVLWLAEEGLSLPEPSSAPCLRIGDLPGEDYGARAVPHIQGGVDWWVREMQAWQRDGCKILLYSLNAGEDERVQELLEGKLPQPCQFLIGPLREGFIHPGLRLAVITSSELFHRSYRPGRPWQGLEPGGKPVRLGALKSGDYVVHQQHGIGRYLGIRPVQTAEEGSMDCLLVEYRASDKLYVPLPDFRMVQKYVASEGARPRLSSLDSRSWEEIKDRVREGVQDIAEQILKLEAARAARPGHAFAPDTHMEEEFAAAFPFEETQDQRRAIEEVKRDMTSPHPMDRLVVGDVGYGKTEVAMRAAMKCVAGLKQAAVLVPTTILADQHARTFTQRFAEYPVRIAMLSRFQSRAAQERVIEDLKTGKIDIVIGTHRLLSADIAFRDLGLLIIDEEHRFGVKDKQRLRALKEGVDALSLSATPIPRTLYQALSGLRGVSLIQSAPIGRQSVATWVGPWSPQRVAEAIRSELARGGQAYYVHNRVRTLAKKVEELRGLIPEARFATAHGQMRSDPLERAMWDFFGRKFDVLVASSIIESGLDIPTVNTLLVEDAQDFGLAQLYQLRGRIGRERRKAYCYLFHPEAMSDIHALAEEARRRLSALREFSELGSGFKLALRDLEIRGAGDLLGSKQHGFMNAIGFEYYCELLQEEISRLRGQASAPAAAPVHLDLGIDAFLPGDYLPGEFQRLDFYKRLLAASKEDLPRLRRELEDLSGPAPVPVQNLFRLMELRCGASALGIREVARRADSIELRFRPDVTLASGVIEKWRRRYEGRLEFLRSLEGEGEGLRIRLAKRDPVSWLSEFLEGFN